MVEIWHGTLGLVAGFHLPWCWFHFRLLGFIFDGMGFMDQWMGFIFGGVGGWVLSFLGLVVVVLVGWWQLRWIGNRLSAWVLAVGLAGARG
nr:hypothetical protein CFP56_41090 [Quercus suber]